jgi:hypothetical protein
MTGPELADAIALPAKAVGGRVHPDLTKRLLRDIGLDVTHGRNDQYDIGKLPLLEYALEQAWAKRVGGEIGLGQYAGLEQALEERANKLYDSLSPTQQATAKRLFVSLVTPGEGREDTRARVTLTASAMQAVVETFAGPQARLVVTGEDAAGGRSAEVTHEALIRHWDKLRVWVDENRANLKTRADLFADRAKWLSQGKDRTLLIERGLRLEAARKLRDQPGDVVVDDIKDYVDASFAADTRRKAWRTLSLAAAATTAIVMTGLAVFGWYHYRVAERRANEITAALIWSRMDFEGKNDPRSDAAVRALWALTTGPTGVREAFLRQLTQDGDQVEKLAAGSDSVVRTFGLGPVPEDVRRLLVPVLAAISHIDIAELRRSPDHTDLLKLGVTREEAEEARIRTLASAVSTLNPTPQQAEMALAPILDLVGQTTNAHQRRTLAEAAEALGPKLAPRQAQAALASVLDLIGQFTDIDQFCTLVRVAAAFATTAQQAQTVLALFPDVVTRTTNSNQLIDLRSALGALGPRLGPEQAEIALGPFLTAMRQPNDAGQLSFFADSARILGADLTSGQAQVALTRILGELLIASDEWSLRVLLKAVETVGPQLAPEQAQAARAPVLNAIDGLVAGYGKTAPLARTPVLDGIGQTTDIDRLTTYANVLKILGATPEQARPARQAVVDALPHATGYRELAALAQAVQILGPTPEEAMVAFVPILYAIRETTNAWELLALREAARVLGPELTSEQAHAALGAALDAARLTTVKRPGASGIRGGTSKD